MNGWLADTWRGGAGEFHAQDLPHGRRLWLVEPISPALVLGSSQRADEVDPERAAQLGLEVCSRRTGGGAVWLDPTCSLWVDLTIDRDDPLWTDDAPTSGVWLGTVFSALLEPLVNGAVEVWTGPYVARPLARALCFAGLAPGEVTVAGAKAVGISQRRTRDGARFQCVVYTRWEPARFAGAFTDRVVAASASELHVATVDIDGPALVDRLLSVLNG
ncbi:MAG: lipoyl protein ligase domain-containing protein [Acidimicrobiales bacterium]